MHDLRPLMHQLVQKKLAASPDDAISLILSGRVTANGNTVLPGDAASVPVDATLAVTDVEPLVAGTRALSCTAVTPRQDGKSDETTWRTRQVVLTMFVPHGQYNVGDKIEVRIRKVR